MNLVQKDIITVYRLALELSGQVDGNSGLPTQDLLHLLKEYQHRWHNFDLRSSDLQTPSTHPERGYQVLYDRLFARTDTIYFSDSRSPATELTILELPSRIHDRYNRQAYLTPLLPLSTTLPRTKIRTLLFEDIPQVSNFIIDNAQDLIVLVQPENNSAYVFLV